MKRSPSQEKGAAALAAWSSVKATSCAPKNSQMSEAPPTVQPQQMNAAAAADPARQFDPSPTAPIGLTIPWPVLPPPPSASTQSIEREREEGLQQKGLSAALVAASIAAREMLREKKKDEEKTELSAVIPAATASGEDDKLKYGEVTPPSETTGDHFLSSNEGGPSINSVEQDTVLKRPSALLDDGETASKKPKFDRCSPSPDTEDGVLIVDDWMIYVNKQLLSTQSPFFDRLFNGETGVAERVLEDVDLNQFEVLMKMVEQTGQSFDGDNIEFVLKLASRFEMKSVLDEAEKYLLTSEATDIHKKLLLSDQYNLAVLQAELLPKYSADLIRELNGSPEYGMLKAETTKLLFRKYIELTTPN